MPGPFIPANRPNLKTTARLYCLVILTESRTVIITRKIETVSQKELISFPHLPPHAIPRVNTPKIPGLDLVIKISNLWLPY
jgi:hypothetical protein